MPPSAAPRPAQAAEAAAAPLAAVAAGAGALGAAAAATRALTWGMNLALARRLSPEAYGLVTVQFQLVLGVILTLSREGFRRGCVRCAPPRRRAAVPRRRPPPRRRAPCRGGRLASARRLLPSRGPGRRWAERSRRRPAAAGAEHAC